MEHPIPKNVPALLPIVKYGDPVLVKKAKPVAAIDEAVLRLIPAMFNTMYAEPGIGLAAPRWAFRCG
jgi:peptide deformylase